VLESDKGVENQVQKGQILSFRILTHGIEADQACLTHRSYIHATTLTRMGSIGFAWVAWLVRDSKSYLSQEFVSSAQSAATAPLTMHCMDYDAHYLHT
jgi:hypothetical protein